MSKRRKVPSATQTDVLVTALRRCCVCFGLHGDDGLKRGQIAHLDRSRDNNSRSNLIFLCFAHHDEFDSVTRQSKGLTRGEIDHFAIALSTHLAAMRASIPAPSPSTAAPLVGDTPSVSVQMGDVFEGARDLTVLPCGARPSWTSSVQRWIDQFQLPTPKELMPKMRLSDLTPLARFPGPQGITRWVAYGASVLDDATTPAAIFDLGANIGKATRRRASIKRIESVLFGTGHGRLSDVEAGIALSSGFKSTGAPRTSLTIFVHSHARCQAIEAALKSRSA